MNEEPIRVVVAFARNAPETRKQEVRSAFERNGVHLDEEGVVAHKAIDLVGIRIDLQFVVEVAATGIAYDVGKDVVRRAINAAREVWEASGSVSKQSSDLTVWLVPDPPHGDAALDAIADEWDTAPPGIRLFVADVGWMDQRDYWNSREAGDGEPVSDRPPSPPD